MSKPTFTTITGIALPLALLSACAAPDEALGPDEALELDEAFELDERFQLSTLEVASDDGLILLQPVELEIAAEVSAAAFETNIAVGLRSVEGHAGCVLGAVAIDPDPDDALDPSTSPADERVAWSTRAEFLVDGSCAKLAGRDDVEVFVAFDPWNKLEGSSFVERLDGDPNTPIIELVAERAVSVIGCESCERLYEVHDPVGLDAQLRELKLSSVVAVLGDDGKASGAARSEATPDFYLSAAARVTGLDKSRGLDDGRVHFEHRLRPLGSSGEGLPLLQQRAGSGLSELETVAVAGPMVINTVSALHIEGAARAALVEGAWSELENFELLSCLVTDFDQAVFDGETEPRANDCGSISVVILRDEPTPFANTGKLRNADVYAQSWGVDAGYGFGYSGLGFEAWIDVNGADLPTTTYRGIAVNAAGSWFEAGVRADATVFDQELSLVDVYGTFIGYHWGGGKMAMKASLFDDDFIPEFELALEDGEPLSLQQMLDAANVDAAPEIATHIDLIGKSFDDGCDTVGAGLKVVATVGIDTEETSITASQTNDGVEVGGTITPFFDISAVAWANTGSFLGFSLGIEAALTLLRVAVPFTATVEVIDFDPLDALRLEFNETVGAMFETLSGYIKFEFTYDGFWGNVSHEHYIATWDGLSEYMDLFTANQRVSFGTDSAGDFCTSAVGDELHIGDYDGDGSLDYLCHNRNSGGKWIDFGPSYDGTDWGRADANWCTGGDDLYVGDFDGDGRDDMLCNGSLDTQIDYADPNGQLWGTDWTGLPNTYCSSGIESAIVFPYEDLDGDGRDDMHCYRPDMYDGAHIVDYADQDGHFGGVDWTGPQDPTSFCGRYDGQTIALQTHHGRYLSALPAIQGAGYTQTTTIEAAARFVVECVDEQAALRTTYGTYVQPLGAADNYTCRQQNFIGPWEQLTPLALSDGKWGFETFHGRYLMAGDAGWGYELNQQQQLVTWESFTVVPQ